MNQLRTHQQNEQDEALDGLIDAVKGIKHNGLAMDKEFTEQGVMLKVKRDLLRNWRTTPTETPKRSEECAER